MPREAINQEGETLKAGAQAVEIPNSISRRELLRIFVQLEPQAATDLFIQVIAQLAPAAQQIVATQVQNALVARFSDQKDDIDTSSNVRKQDLDRVINAVQNARDNG